METLDHQTIKAALHLAVAGGFGPVCFNTMVASGFATPLEMLQAPEDRLPVFDGGIKKGGVGLQLARARFARGEDKYIRRSLSLLEKGSLLWVRGTPVYPAALLDVVDAPTVMMGLGDGVEAALAKPCVAIVGSRDATSYGLDMAAALAGGLARAGVTVVSGAAAGVDCAAHTAAMDAGGSTVAVLGVAVGSSRAVKADDEKAVAAAKLEMEVRVRARQQGGLMTEMFPESDQHAGSFTQRNRIISGLCRGVVVVEGAEGSGTAYTAGFARKQGRMLMAVPGYASEPMAYMPHAVLRDGGRAVMCAEDVLVELELLPRPETYVTVKRAVPKVRPSRVHAARTPAVAPEGLSEAQQKAWDALRGAKQAMLVDDVADRAGLSSSAVSSALLELELMGVCTRAAGGAYALA